MHKPATTMNTNIIQQQYITSNNTYRTLTEHNGAQKYTIKLKIHNKTIYTINHMYTKVKTTHSKKKKRECSVTVVSNTGCVAWEISSGQWNRSFTSYKFKGS
jgi:hypothetical protein